VAESFGLVTEVGWVEGTAECLELYASLEAARAPADAALLLGAADALRGQSGFKRQELERHTYDEAAATARALLGEHPFSAGLAAGASASLSELVARVAKPSEERTLA
jgi:hypothetical protein